MTLGIATKLVFDRNEIMKLLSGMVFIWPTFFSTQLNFSYAYWPEPTFLHFSLTSGVFWLASNCLLTTFCGFYEILYFFFVMQPWIIFFCFFFFGKSLQSINLRSVITSTLLKYLVFSRAYRIWKAKFVDPNWEVLIKSDFLFQRTPTKGFLLLGPFFFLLLLLKTSLLFLKQRKSKRGFR